MKTVRLTESDLIRIVKRVLAEQDVNILKGKKITKEGLTIQETKPVKNREGQWEIYLSEGNQPTNEYRIFACKAHERGEYRLAPNSPDNVLTEEESKMLYNALCPGAYYKNSDSQMG